MINGLAAFRAEGDWVTGNLHAHAIVAKDTFDRAGAVEKFRELGHDFLAITDHAKHLLSGGNRERLYEFARGDHGVVVLPGAEIHPRRARDQQAEGYRPDQIRRRGKRRQQYQWVVHLREAHSLPTSSFSRRA